MKVFVTVWRDAMGILKGRAFYNRKDAEKCAGGGMDRSFLELEVEGDPGVDGQMVMMDNIRLGNVKDIKILTPEEDEEYRKRDVYCMGCTDVHKPADPCKKDE